MCGGHASAWKFINAGAKEVRIGPREVKQWKP